MKTANLIPQVFYDLIARIVPGNILILCGLVVYLGPEAVIQGLMSLAGPSERVPEVSFYLFAAIEALAYMLSFVVMGAWLSCLELLKRYNPLFLSDDDVRWNRVKRNLASDLSKAGLTLGPPQETKPEALPSLALMYDFVRLHAPDIGARLVKVRAECHMCAAMYAGLTGLALWNAVKTAMNFSATGAYIEAGLILMACAFWTIMRHLEERFMTGLSNYWSLLRAPAIHDETPSPRLTRQVKAPHSVKQRAEGAERR